MIVKVITCTAQLPAFFIRFFSYMDRIVSKVSGKYGKIRLRKSLYSGWVLRRGFLTRISTKISLCLKITRYKEVCAIKKVHYREVLPCDEFIIQQISINRTYVRYFHRNWALFNFCIQVINGVNLIYRCKKVVNSWFDNYCSGGRCNILTGSF